MTEDDTIQHVTPQAVKLCMQSLIFRLVKLFVLSGWKPKQNFSVHFCSLLSGEEINWELQNIRKA